MSSPSTQPVEGSPAEYWWALLRPIVEKDKTFADDFLQRLGAHKLTFGDRVHCPFLRPFFLTPEEEKRVRPVSEMIYELAERVTLAALADKNLLAQFHLRPEEERLARLPAGYGRVSTAARLDAFLLPDSLKFAEYNGESPAGAGYSETLAEIFMQLPVMTKFSKAFEVHSYPLSAKLLDALVASYLEWGGTSKRPQIAIVDWRGVVTSTEFEILKGRFEKMGVPTLICDPRDLTFDGKKLMAQGKKIDLVYRRVLINDMVAKPAECEALVKAYTANAVCVANSLRCKVPHVKTFFAVLTDERNNGLFSLGERETIAKHIPWTRVVADMRTVHYDRPVDLLAFIRAERENLVIKPSDEYGGTGVNLGWEMSESEWDKVIQTAVSSGVTGSGGGTTWIVQERIPIRREDFPYIKGDGTVEMQNLLVDFAPYLFAGKLSGFLTRMSATGLANVTSGGGQVPAFRVSPKQKIQRN
jgi:A circularly permuted ATPgrasp